MNLFQVVSFEPQIAAAEHGKEPSLESALLHYYTSHDVPLKTAENLVREYLGVLYEKFGA